jgi:hypothetical protein
MSCNIGIKVDVTVPDMKYAHKKWEKGISLLERFTLVYITSRDFLSHVSKKSIHLQDHGNINSDDHDVPLPSSTSPRSNHKI